MADHRTATVDVVRSVMDALNAGDRAEYVLADKGRALAPARHRSSGLIPAVGAGSRAVLRRAGSS
jgi:hypothetical protein